jgi:hypothetical protein
MRRIFVPHQGETTEHIEIFEVVPTQVLRKKTSRLPQ